MESEMKILAPLIIAAGLGLASLAQGDPSENGLEHRNSEFSPTRTGSDKPVSVPDAGGTLSLLGLGMAGLAFWRIKLA